MGAGTELSNGRQTVGRNPRTVIVSQSLMSNAEVECPQSIVHVRLAWCVQRGILVDSIAAHQNAQVRRVARDHGTNARRVRAVWSEGIPAGKVDDTGFFREDREQ